MSDAAIQVTLRLRPDAGPIAGEIEDEAGSSTDFHGWMDLAALLEASRSAGTAARTAGSRRGGSTAAQRLDRVAV